MAAAAASASPLGPERIAFAVLPGFPLYSLVPAIEALRLANQNSGRLLYEWQLVSIDGHPVISADGLVMSVHGGLHDCGCTPLAFVCAGAPVQHVSRPLLSWLRRLNRAGSRLGAIHAGTFVLAEAGLLKGHAVTLHWETIGEFRQRYPDITVREQLFVMDRSRMTCAGGHAALDMMLHLIRTQHGAAIAQSVANGFVAVQPRAAAIAQRASLTAKTGETSLIARILQRLERDPAMALSFAAIAAAAEATPRAVQEAFRETVGETPMRYLRRFRLQLACDALCRSGMTVRDIAQAHGFASIEVFSRAFKAQYGFSPRIFRLQAAREQAERRGAAGPLASLG